MPRRTGPVAALCLVAGLALTTLASSGAAAAPVVLPTPAAPVLTQRIETVHRVAVGGDVTSLEPACRKHEVLSGGGFSVGSIGFSDKVFVNAPLDDRTWLVQLIVDGPPGSAVDVWAHAVCLSVGKPAR